MSNDYIVKKTCNALFKEAKVRKAEDLVPIDAALEIIAGVGVSGVFQAAERAAERAKKAIGGLWVGGTIYLSEKELIFKANKLNKLAHSNENLAKIDLNLIDKIETKYAFITNIIEVSVSGGIFKFRCFGAKKFAKTIEVKMSKNKN